MFSVGFIIVLLCHLRHSFKDTGRLNLETEEFISISRFGAEHYHSIKKKKTLRVFAVSPFNYIFQFCDLLMLLILVNKQRNKPSKKKLALHDTQLFAMLKKF